MSDYLAIGGVSAVLRSLLSNAVASGGPASILGANPAITNLAPDLVQTGANEPARINLFMYYASMNATLRNLDLPSMNSRGQRLSNPPLALNLHYLVSAYGSNPFDHEILLGFAMQVFHESALIGRQQIADALAGLLAITPASQEAQLVAAGTLAGQIEQIRITPEALSTEEIYRLWAAFQTSYRPTTSYQISVVVIQRTDGYASNLPVQKYAVLALPLASPVVEAITPAMVQTGETLILGGSNFVGDIAADTSVSFDNLVSVSMDAVQTNLIRLTVPPTLSAGVHTVRVKRAVRFPTSSSTHTGFSSSPAPLQIIPTIQNTTPVGAKQGQPLTLTIVPGVGRTQAVVVYFGDEAMPIAARPSTDPDTSPTIVLPVPATATIGTFPLRLEVDGAQSRLTRDTNPVSPTFGQWLPQVGVTA